MDGEIVGEDRLEERGYLGHSQTGWCESQQNRGARALTGTAPLLLILFQGATQFVGIADGVLFELQFRTGGPLLPDRVDEGEVSGDLAVGFLQGQFERMEGAIVAMEQIPVWGEGAIVEIPRSGRLDSNALIAVDRGEDFGERLGVDEAHVGGPTQSEGVIVLGSVPGGDRSDDGDEIGVRVQRGVAASELETETGERFEVGFGRSGILPDGIHLQSHFLDPG